MPRVKRQTTDSAAAWDILATVDPVVLHSAVMSILRQGGAVMVGQTRDNAKLIATVYLDGDQHKEYCEDGAEALKFLGEFQV